MAGPAGLRLGDLAERMTYSRPRLTHRLARLIDTGLVERRSCKDDKRGGVATLTDQGAQVLEAAVVTKRDDLRRLLFEPLDEPDLIALARIMTKVRRRLGDTYTSPDEADAADGG
jgi:DNA-binding MarR family transcriptional regulator